MTIAEAENQYFVEVENLRKKFEKQIKKEIIIFDIICAVVIVTGTILTIIGYTTPLVFDVVFEKEVVPFEATLERYFGIMLLCLGAFWLLIFNLLFKFSKKKGPRSFLEQNKNLYFNYLKCVDMDDSDKKFYKEKLEEIRHIELINAIHSSVAAASSAILFSTMAK